MRHTSENLFRLCDSLALRVSIKQRAYLEQLAIEHGISLGEVVRICIDNAMTSGRMQRNAEKIERQGRTEKLIAPGKATEEEE